MSSVEQIEHFTGFGLYDKSFVQVNVQTLDNAVTKQTEKDNEVYNQGE